MHRMDADAVFAHVARQRGAAADMFEGLTAEQLATPSLCDGWSVQVLAAHMALPMTLSKAGFVFEVLKQRGDLNRAMDVASRRAAAQSRHEQTVRTLRDRADHRFKPPGAPPVSALVEVMLHTRDAARPLGLDVGPTAQQWQPALDFLASSAARRVFVPGGRLAGLALSATDSDWSIGDGEPVEGPSEALALAMVGRAVALDELHGSGVTTLRSRIR